MNPRPNSNDQLGVPALLEDLLGTAADRLSWRGRSAAVPRRSALMSAPSAAPKVRPTVYRGFDVGNARPPPRRWRSRPTSGDSWPTTTRSMLGSYDTASLAAFTGRAL